MSGLRPTLVDSIHLTDDGLPSVGLNIEEYDYDDNLSELERGGGEANQTPEKETSEQDTPEQETSFEDDMNTTDTNRDRTVDSEANSSAELSRALTVLDMIRLNCINCSNYHNKNYRWFKATFNYYRVPVVIISACNAFVVSATKAYLSQTTIDTISTVMSLVVGIVTGLELFFNLQVNTEAERVSHKKYYMLAVEIIHTLYLYKNNPAVDLFSYANQKIQDYLRINASSSVITEDIDDLMTPAQSIIQSETPPYNKPQTKSRKKHTLLPRLRNSKIKKLKHVLSKMCSPKKHRRKQLNKQNQQIIHAGLQLLHRHLDTGKQANVPTSPVGVETDIPSLFSVPASSAYMSSSYTSPVLSVNSESPNSNSPYSNSPKITRPMPNKRKIHPNARNQGS